MNTIRLNTIGTPFPKAEGGGGDTPSGGSNYEYFVYNQQSKRILLDIAFAMKVTDTETYGGLVILPMGSYHNLSDTNAIEAVVIDMSFVVCAQGLKMSVKDMIILQFGQETYDTLPRLTEEEFYNLNA